MVSIVHAEQFRAAESEHPWALSALRLAWHDYRQRRALRRTLALAGLRGPRLAADMGLDPDEVRAAMGGWHELMPNGLLVHRR